MMEEPRKTGFKTPLKFLSITRSSNSDSKLTLPKISSRFLGKRLSTPHAMTETKGNNSLLESNTKGNNSPSESQDDLYQVKYRNVKVTTPVRPMSVCVTSATDPKTRWRSHTTDQRYPLLLSVSSEGQLNPVSRDCNSNIEENPKIEDQNLPDEKKSFFQGNTLNTKLNIEDEMEDLKPFPQQMSVCTGDLLSLEKNRECDVSVQNSASVDSGSLVMVDAIGQSKKGMGSKALDKPIFYGVLPVCSQEKAVSLHPKREITQGMSGNPKREFSQELLNKDDTLNSSVNEFVSTVNCANNSSEVIRDYKMEEVKTFLKDELPPQKSKLTALKQMSRDSEMGVVFSQRTRDLLLENDTSKNSSEDKTRTNVSFMSRSEKLRNKVQSLLSDNEDRFVPSKEEFQKRTSLIENVDYNTKSTNEIKESNSSVQCKKEAMTLAFNDKGRQKRSEDPLSPIDTLLTSPTRPPRRRLSKRRYFNPKTLEEDEFIGFASLPDQVHRKAVRRGFDFSLMVLGDSGLGKSTLINSLFLTDLYKERVVPDSADLVERTVGTVKKQLEIEEKGVKVRLTIVDTPGYNDAVNADDSWKKVLAYVDQQFQLYYQAESGLNRKNIQDTRIHCCLYFVSPYGHGLKPLDILVMKKLHNKVNIVPLIAKADVLTPKEIKRLKAKVLEDISKNDINIYTFPDCDSDEDEEFKEQDKALKDAVPFSVIGSNTVVEAGGKKIRGRMYPWGIVEVDNPKHCDFLKLRQMLISTHMQDLKDITSEIHYENYRAEHLLSNEVSRSNRERTKLKRDSMVNIEKAVETEHLLQEKEAEIQRMQEMLAKMQAQLQGNTNTPMNGRLGNVR